MEMPRVTVVSLPLPAPPALVFPTPTPPPLSSVMSSTSTSPSPVPTDATAESPLTLNIALGFSFPIAPSRRNGWSGESWMYTLAAVSWGREASGRRKTTRWLSGWAGEVGRRRTYCVGERTLRLVWTGGGRGRELVMYIWGRIGEEGEGGEYRAARQLCSRTLVGLG